jgi:hypothetical protein
MNWLLQSTQLRVSSVYTIGTLSWHLTVKSAPLSTRWKLLANYRFRDGFEPGGVTP